MNTRYQQATPKDLIQLVPLIADFYTLENIPFDKGATLNSLEELISNPSWGYLWMIKADSDLIGYLIVTLGYSLEFKGRDAFVDEIYLTEQYRNQGIGSQVLIFAADFCKNQGVRAFHLEVARDNERAQRVYEKLGFVKREQYFLMTNYLK